MDTPWRIELLGGLRATRDDRLVTRFQTHKTGALLAYLAYHCKRAHPREVLIELLWPENEPRASREHEPNSAPRPSAAAAARTPPAHSSSPAAEPGSSCRRSRVR